MKYQLFNVYNQILKIQNNYQVHYPIQLFKYEVLIQFIQLDYEEVNLWSTLSNPKSTKSIYKTNYQKNALKKIEKWQQKLILAAQR